MIAKGIRVTSATSLVISILEKRLRYTRSRDKSFSDLTAPISFCVTKEKHPIRTKACTTSMSANRIASTRTLI